MMTGYQCKNCYQPSPIGVGYAIPDDEDAYLASAATAVCECGYSQQPEEEQ